jgi:hypothetical protein
MACSSDYSKVTALGELFLFFLNLHRHSIFQHLFFNLYFESKLFKICSGLKIKGAKFFQILFFKKYGYHVTIEKTKNEVE